MIIDIHAHATAFPEYAPPFRWGGRFCSAEEVIKFYDEINIEKGVLLPISAAEGQLTPMTSEAIKFMADKYPDRFLWFCNVDPRAMDNNSEIYDCYEDEIFIRRAMIKNAKTKVFLCDDTKIGKISSYHLCSLKDVDYIASNLPLPNSIPSEKCLTLCGGIVIDNCSFVHLKEGRMSTARGRTLEYAQELMKSLQPDRNEKQKQLIKK